MCTDTTKQEIAFLIALINNSSGLSRLEASRDLPRFLRSMDWPEYLADEPRSVDILFAEGARKGTIERSAPFAWRASERGRERLHDLIHRFAPEKDREKLRQASGVFSLEN